GFAIPSNMVKAVMDQLLEFGEVRRGLLGVNIYTVTPDIAEAYGVEEIQGALVSQVVPGSAADEAGIEAGDIITKVNDETIKSATELRNAIGLLRVEEKVRIEFVRDGKSRSTTATLGMQIVEEQVAAADIHPGLQGAELADADPANPERGGMSGVLVVSVEPGSPAQQRQLRGGDVIVAVNRQRVASVAEFREIAGGDALLLSIRRGNATLFLPIR
ncbi:MAG: PDZ domain-containing protein, partial [Gammaproteobacteria bacterium]